MAEVWPGDDRDVVPAHLLQAIADHGGLVAGAFVGADLAGFVFGFPGLEADAAPPRPIHCSHQLGVHPRFRDTGVGFALKQLQWDFVRRQGLERIVWTYDPLLSRNARLNIAKLGAVCSTYIRDYYGEMRDGLNMGLPSDRFRVDWWINSERVMARMTAPIAPQPASQPTSQPTQLPTDAIHLNPATAGSDPLPPEPIAVGQLPPTVLLAIPHDFLALKAADPGLALHWRLATRAAFEALFERGYLVSDFIRLALPQPRVAYVLTR